MLKNRGYSVKFDQNKPNLSKIQKINKISSCPFFLFCIVYKVTPSKGVY